MTTLEEAMRAGVHSAVPDYLLPPDVPEEPIRDDHEARQQLNDSINMLINCANFGMNAANGLNRLVSYTLRGDDTDAAASVAATFESLQIAIRIINDIIELYTPEPVKAMNAEQKQQLAEQLKQREGKA